VDSRFSVDFVHRVVFTRGLFQPGNPTLVQTLRGGASGLAVFVDSGVAAAMPQLESQLNSMLSAAESAPELRAFLVVPGGEACKNDRTVVDQVLDVVNRHHLCRRSWVLAIGGGAVLDAVGYGAAVSHRGVRLIRAPSTVLAQDDAGLGVKNGINRYGKKNFEGTFAVPWAVLNDLDLLASLPDRFWCGGFSEAVKIALLRDRDFFAQIEHRADQIRKRDMSAAVPVIQRCAELHLAHIVGGGDPFESQEARPLDYGHWAAHKLEQLTEFQLSHGEAVAIGVALDTRYSAEIGWLTHGESDRVLSCLERLGLPVSHPALADTRLTEGLEEFREHLGGNLTVTLLRGIGSPSDANAMSTDAIRRSIDAIMSSSRMTTI